MWILQDLYLFENCHLISIDINVYCISYDIHLTFLFYLSYFTLLLEIFTLNE